MSGHRHTDAAILAQHVHAIVVAELHLGLRIVVEVQYIAGLEEIAAGSRINQACRVMALGKFSYFHGVVLPPAFVERHPYADRRH